MNHREAGVFWNGNADAWTRLARAGCDIYRDGLNTPAFLEMLPDVAGRRGIDIGCGEGHNTRLLAKRGARMTGIDIAEKFIGHAQEFETREPLGIEYRVASAVELPFPDETFAFATAFMSLMDVPETRDALAEAHRVLRPQGFLQFSICHPCFDTPQRRNLRDANGLTYAIEVGDYYRQIDGRIDEWIFSGASPEIRMDLPRFKVPRFTRTLSEWLNLLIETGFRLEQVAEPRPTDEAVRRYPGLQDAQVVAYFLHVRARKSSRGGTSQER